MRIDVHIERLLLDEGAASDRDRVVNALREELRRQTAEGHLSSAALRGDHIARVGASVVQADPVSRPERVGAAVAGAVHRGVWRE